MMEHPEHANIFEQNKNIVQVIRILESLKGINALIAFSSFLPQQSQYYKFIVTRTMMLSVCMLSRPVGSGRLGAPPTIC